MIIESSQGTMKLIYVRPELLKAGLGITRRPTKGREKTKECLGIPIFGSIDCGPAYSST